MSLENSESVDQLIKSEKSAARLILALNTNATGCNLISELYVSRAASFHNSGAVEVNFYCLRVDVTCENAISSDR